MAFRFRLQSVLTYRQSLEEDARLRLAREQRLLDNHRQRVEDLRQERVRLIAAFEARKQQVVTAAMFTMCVQAIGTKEVQITEQLRAVESQRLVVEECRQALAVRMQERKVIEKIREKKYRDYLVETAKAEQKISDEQAVLRYGGKQRG